MNLNTDCNELVDCCSSVLTGQGILLARSGPVVLETMNDSVNCVKIL